MEEVSKLYAYIQTLPNGPQKTHFLKKVSMWPDWEDITDETLCYSTLLSVQFESSRKIPGTPQPYTKPSRAWKKVSEWERTQLTRTETLCICPGRLSHIKV